MPPFRQFLGLLLVAVYAMVSTFGMAFVICQEGDGSRNLEALGADCCEPGTTLPTGADDALSLTSADDSDCGDCQDHMRAIDLDPTTVEEARTPLPATVALPPPAVPAPVSCPTLARERFAFRAPAAHPPPSTVAACLGSVVLRC